MNRRVKTWDGKAPAEPPNPDPRCERLPAFLPSSSDRRIAHRRDTAQQKLRPRMAKWSATRRTHSPQFRPPMFMESQCFSVKLCVLCALCFKKNSSLDTVSPSGGRGLFQAANRLAARVEPRPPRDANRLAVRVEHGDHRGQAWGWRHDVWHGTAGTGTENGVFPRLHALLPARLPAVDPLGEWVEWVAFAGCAFYSDKNQFMDVDGFVPVSSPLPNSTVTRALPGS